MASFLNFFKKRENVTLNESTKASNFFVAVAKYSVLKFAKYNERENFEYPDETLYEIKRAIGTDSYISESHNKYKEKIFKPGYYFKGNTDVIEYLKKRFLLMSTMNETITDVLFQEIADDLVDYANAYLLKLRSPEIPFMNLSRKDDKNFIGGYMRVDPCHVVVVKDKYNNILRYEVERMGYENQKVDKDDMIHYYLHRKAEEKTGTPRLEPVLEDIKALRDIEGDVLTLIHRFCFPLYHVKVGLPQTGYNGTQGDIDDIQDKIESMSEDGILITNEKVTIDTIGAQNNALNVLPYLEYFEDRVFSGLNTSQAQMGRNGEKTPDSLEAQIHDTVKFIEKNFALFTMHYIINELLFEGGYNPILNEDERIEMVFNEISLDTRVKLENHEALKYQSNIQTRSETRTNIGVEQEVDETDLYVDNVTLYTSEMQTQQKTEGEIELAKVQAKLNPTPVAATSQTKTPDKNNKKQKQTKAVTNNNRPQNQHGVYSVKIKESLENLQKEKNLEKECYKTYYNIRNNNFEKANKKAYQDDILIHFGKLLSVQKTQAQVYCQSNFVSDTSYLEELYVKETASYIEKLYNELNSEEDLDKKFYRLQFTITYWAKKYFWHCVCLIQKEKGRRILTIDFSSDKDKDAYNEKVYLATVADNAICREIPPFHPGCRCGFKIEK